MKLDEAKQKFVHSWGVLGSNWGINKTMAQIHALLLVSEKPLSTEEVMEYLQISRGNANMNLRGLIDWGIVTKEIKIGERKDFFKADKDIWEVARRITEERSKREVEPVIKILNEVKNVEEESEEAKEFKETIEKLESFTSNLDGLVKKFVKSDEHWFYKTVIKLMK
ncbi:GbsR/MarR family transcriptional regulator [Aureivirga marina]|uniref:GbsR/MarR family transcriptional regulator n=1 Tax=Aureivirga marina TaxID=1182451 RepID=UPI0018C9E17E|nr:transcriptional regulator [Aureivirga marina]